MMVGHLGIPELILVLLMSVLWIIPIVVAVWALVTLHGIRTGQQAMVMRLEAIERLLQTQR